MGTGSLTSSIRWVPRYPCWKWLGDNLLLRKVFSNTIFWFFQCLLFLFQWVILLPWDEYHLSLQKWVAPIGWLLSLPWRVSYRLALLLVFPRSTLFPDALSVILEFRLLLFLLLLCLPITLQRDLGWWPRCCDWFEKYSISLLGRHSINAISWHGCEGDDSK